MKALIAFVLEGTLAASKRPLDANYSMLESNFNEVADGIPTMSSGPPIRTCNESAV